MSRICSSVRRSLPWALTTCFSKIFGLSMIRESIRPAGETSALCPTRSLASPSTMLPLVKLTLSAPSRNQSGRFSFRRARISVITESPMSCATKWQPVMPDPRIRRRATSACSISE